MSSEGEASATGPVVLDASAVLAVLEDESGAEEIEHHLESDLAAIGTVNLAEVVGKLAERGMPEAEIREAVSALALEVYPFDEILAFEAGMLRPKTKDRGLSLGDRACLALGGRLEALVLTTERVWAGLDGVEVIRRGQRGTGDRT